MYVTLQKVVTIAALRWSPVSESIDDWPPTRMGRHKLSTLVHVNTVSQSERRTHCHGPRRVVATEQVGWNQRAVTSDWRRTVYRQMM